MTRREPFDFEAARGRGRFEAWLFDVFVTPGMDRRHGERKAEVLGSLRGTVVEGGPGAGANLPYYPSGVHVIGIEPNPAMHPRLHQNARSHGVDLELRTVRGEQMDVASDRADAVVGTLLLCGVDAPTQVVSEIRRVLKPGGTYFFLEHVVAPEGTVTRRLQQLLFRPHRWLFSGCEVDRDTTSLLEGAGFSDLELQPVDLGLFHGYARHSIIGTATN